MLTFWLNDPQLQRSTLVVVIEKDNLARMEKADPVTLFPCDEGGALQRPEYPQKLSCMISYEPDSGELYSILNQNNSKALLLYLTRGYQFTPIDGKRADIPMDGRRKDDQ